MFNIFEPTATLRGLIELSIKTAIMQNTAARTLEKSASDRANVALARFVTATHELSGEMKRSWRIVRVGVGQYAVVNGAEHKGVAYPGIQITGSGDQGLGAPGFHGTFTSGWAGQAPNSGLRAAWIDEARKPMAVPKLF